MVCALFYFYHKQNELSMTSTTHSLRDANEIWGQSSPREKRSPTAESSAAQSIPQLLVQNNKEALLSAFKLQVELALSEIITFHTGHTLTVNCVPRLHQMDITVRPQADIREDEEVLKEGYEALYQALGNFYALVSQTVRKENLGAISKMEQAASEIPSSLEIRIGGAKEDTSLQDTYFAARSTVDLIELLKNSIKARDSDDFLEDCRRQTLHGSFNASTSSQETSPYLNFSLIGLRETAQRLLSLGEPRQVADLFPSDRPH